MSIKRLGQTAQATKTAFVFPGQGSQKVGMLAELAEQFSVVRDTFTEASEALDRKSTRLNSSHLKLSRMPSSA